MCHPLPSSPPSRTAIADTNLHTEVSRGLWEGSSVTPKALHTHPLPISHTSDAIHRHTVLHLHHLQLKAIGTVNHSPLVSNNTLCVNTQINIRSISHLTRRCASPFPDIFTYPAYSLCLPHTLHKTIHPTTCIRTQVYMYTHAHIPTHMQRTGTHSTTGSLCLT